MYVCLDKPVRSKTTLDVIRDIRASSGLRGLFTGLVPRLVKVAPACAIMIATFEHSKQVFYRLSMRNSEKQKDLDENNTKYNQP